MIIPNPVHVIGGGLAGCEASFQLASDGIPVVLHEMRPIRKTDAHQSAGLAELVCSNSFRSDDAAANAIGVLHQEMRILGSLILQAADAEKSLLVAHWLLTASGFLRLLRHELPPIL